MRPEPQGRSSSKNQIQMIAPGHEEIAGRAYQLYLERGSGDGYDVDDWLRAEQELARQRTEATARRPKLSKPEAA